jgi:hypothetical protein
VLHQKLSNELSFVGFEVLVVLTMRSTVVWDVTSCSLVDFYEVSEDLTALLAYSETSAYLLTTRCYNAEDGPLHCHRCEILRSKIVNLL